jgi:FkbM family methyltransferase
MTADEFRSQILQILFQDLHRIESDNYAPERFSMDGVDRSGTFDVGKHALFLTWFIENYESVFTAFMRLSDDASRNLFVDVIRYRLAGHLHVRIRTHVHQLAVAALQFQQAFQATPSAIPTSGMFGGLVHIEGTWNGITYEVDTLKDSLKYLLLYRQYFFARDGVRIQPEPGDHVIDGGAFTGDSACVFSKAVGPSGRVYSFDPVQNHMDIIKTNIGRPGYENVTLFGYGLSDRSVEAPPIRLGEYQPGWRVDDSLVPLFRIDDLVIDRRIEHIDFIKMDIEGSEMAALRGAVSSICRFKPKLAISVYHKPNDLFEVANFIHDLNLGYRLYFDHYTIWDEESVLYASVA